ncbi:ciliary-associated calcium-binding coiled-coil protein 1 isoform X2 [Tachysurus fulvidraco]|uniref:ciliary-associated calcium-binding coiled-coil protein 1 isoform X2 n=1 Tax=Tachysurus fulvidraco TaxID=1234273 RepID=UPI001FED8543|nr:ciliary-associated calcium-binding coiled-coil protein 1 isoform X2 [Tachysurus fulvidraco]
MPTILHTLRAGNSADDMKTTHTGQAHEAGEMFPQWPCLSRENLNLLMELSVDEVQLKFVDVLELKKHETCVKEASLLDYFVGGFWWAKEMSFTSQQISFVMALLQKLLDNIKDKRMPFADNFKELTRMLLATRRSPPSAGATFNPPFDADQIRSITDYFSSSLFQHYRLYEFVFTHLRDEMLIGTERNIEVCSADFVAPMEDGTPADDLRLTAPSTATPPDQDSNTHVEKNVDDSAQCEQGETLQSLESFSVEDV